MQMILLRFYIYLKWVYSQSAHKVLSVLSPMHSLIAWTQDLNPGLPHPNQPPTTQIQAPPHVVHQI